MTAFLLSLLGFVSMFSLFALGGVGALIAGRNDRLANWIGNGTAILGSLCALLFSGETLLQGVTPTFSLASALPFLSFTFRVDPLSAFFMFVISLVALVCSVYALGYARHFYGHYNLGTLGFFYNAFIAGMLAVVTTHNILMFLIAWEIMSLSSYFLVIYEHRKKENVAGGLLYFIMTHVGTAFIVFALFLLYRATGSFDFDVIKSSAGTLSPLIANSVFLCALIGFGMKAGIIPLHIWLPAAHPAAPSHVSALMSGVMIKTGIYMFVRVFFDLLPSTSLWWGVLVLVLGAVSSLLGVLYALTEHDLKRLLAFHSIENIGIILLGLGSSLIFLSLHLPALALLGLIAALFHTLNHAIFKALLFLAGGAVVAETHTRNIEEYGGLIKYMPTTAFMFLIGSMAISGLPPFNGFFSEWLTFQSLFGGVALSLGMRVLFVLAIGALAFTGGFAAACFVKAFGATFLARPRSEEVRHAHEVSLFQTVSMGALALLTLVIGISAGPVARMLGTVAVSTSAFTRGDMLSAVAASSDASGNPLSAAISMPALALVLLVALAVAGAFVAVVARRQKVVTNLTWDCGTDLGPRMEITATGFSRSILMVMRSLVRPTIAMRVEADQGLEYFPTKRSVRLAVRDVYASYLYRPIIRGVMYASKKTKCIQNGNVNTYILYIFLTLLLLLGFLPR